jgi:hypothetical protein
MERKTSLGVEWADDYDHRYEPPWSAPSLAPEEGLRLMRAFVNVRRPALREAIIEFVTKLSQGDSPRA